MGLFDDDGGIYRTRLPRSRAWAYPKMLLKLAVVVIIVVFGWNLFT